MPPHEAGNVIYAKTDAHKRWVPIFIGQADLTQRAAMERDRASCIEAKGAIHVHLHVNFDKEDRLGEEQELSNFPQAYTPDGCNKDPTR